MKRKAAGRFVLEAAFLTPGITLLLVYLVYFTLYAHDCAVLTHGALESGVKGLYAQELTDAQIEQKIQSDLQQKLPERLLWIEDVQVEVDVSPLRAVIRLSGEGPFLSVGQIEAERTLYRIDPCGIIRRSRWLRE